MRKFIASTLAAITFGAGLAAVAAPADAASYRGSTRYYSDRNHSGRHNGNDAAAAAVVAGIAGLAIGAALSSHNSGSYASSYDAPGYGQSYGYAPRYGYGYDSYRTCIVRQRAWDPYSDRMVMVERPVPC